MHIGPLDPRSDDAARLLELSDRLAMALYPPESNHLDSAAVLAEPTVRFVGAYIDGALVGCGAVKLLDDDGRYGEIKRVFVLEEHRGHGVATAIMRDLERHLRSIRVEVARLETGVKQAAALALYRTLGYVERGPFGAYKPDPLSIFMEKRLA
jgi:putative acetyltransferase